VTDRPRRRLRAALASHQAPAPADAERLWEVEAEPLYPPAPEARQRLRFRAAGLAGVASALSELEREARLPLQRIASARVVA